MDILFLLLLLMGGWMFVGSFKKKLSVANLNTLRKLYFFHILFGIYYCFFVYGDSIGYWNQAKTMTFQNFLYSIKEQQGSLFLYALNYYPSNVLNLSYFTGTMIYTLIGFIGLTYFYLTAIHFIPKNPKFNGYYLFPFVFYLPNLHFWSCAVGKDSLVFFAIGMFVYGLIKPYTRLPLIVFSLLVCYLIRPHIALFMLLSFGLAFFTGKNIPVFRRVLFLVLMVGVAVIIFPMVMKYAKIEEASLESFNQYSSVKIAKLGSANNSSAVDISSYPLPLKFFTFLFRPLFFDINGIPSVLASIENAILLVLVFFVLKTKPLLSFKKAPFVIQGMVFFLMIGTLIFSQSLGNLGIMIRMRNMFLPSLLLFIMWHFYLKQNEASEDHQKT